MPPIYFWWNLRDGWWNCFTHHINHPIVEVANTWSIHATTTSLEISMGLVRVTIPSCSKLRGARLLIHRLFAPYFWEFWSFHSASRFAGLQTCFPQSFRLLVFTSRLRVRNTFDYWLFLLLLMDLFDVHLNGLVAMLMLRIWLVEEWRE
jgi:hypothetical protein